MDAAAHAEVATFGQMVLIALTKTYALRMAAVFMISLATMWLKTGSDATLAGHRDLRCWRWGFCSPAISACGSRWRFPSGCWSSACCC